MLASKAGGGVGEEISKITTTGVYRNRRRGDRRRCAAGRVFSFAFLALGNEGGA